jgi:asparagine synthetase B (glutamine-hydrolysing)/ribosomal protein S27E
MCGIGGFLRMGDHPIDPDQVKVLLCTLANRGVDAAGIVTMTGDKVEHLKAPSVSWELAASKEFDEFLEKHLTEKTDIVLLHARGASPGGGDPCDNRNNHPMEAGMSRVMHNGFIHNHDWVMKELHAERSAETDSDVIRAILDTYGITQKGIAELSKLSGHAAIAAVSPKYPGKLLLGRSGNPVCVAWNEELEHFMWASEKHMLFSAGKSYDKRIKGKNGMGVWFYKPYRLMYGNMNNNSGWIMSREHGLEFHGELRICSGQRDPRVYNLFQNPKFKQERENKRRSHTARKGNRAEKALVVVSNSTFNKIECPGCRKVAVLTDDQKKIDLWKMTCRACGAKFAQPPAGAA